MTLSFDDFMMTVKFKSTLISDIYDFILHIIMHDFYLKCLNFDLLRMQNQGWLIMGSCERFLLIFIDKQT